MTTAVIRGNEEIDFCLVIVDVRVFVLISQISYHAAKACMKNAG